MRSRVHQSVAGDRVQIADTDQGAETVDPGRVYARVAPIYDALCGPLLQPGRRRAARCLRALGGTDLLEVGVGTGLNAPLYERHWNVVGVDVAAGMLVRARRRLQAHRVSNVRLFEMDAVALEFADASFDLVYAAYAVSAVPDPVAVMREMARVCRPGGHVVLLGHFLSGFEPLACLERAVVPLSLKMGFRTDLAIAPLVAESGLSVVSSERVNIIPLWSLVVCQKATG